MCLAKIETWNRWQHSKEFAFTIMSPMAGWPRYLVMQRSRLKIALSPPRANTRHQHWGVLFGHLDQLHIVWSKACGHWLRLAYFVPEDNTSETENLGL